MFLKHVIWYFPVVAFLYSLEMDLIFFKVAGWQRINFHLNSPYAETLSSICE